MSFKTLNILLLMIFVSHHTMAQRGKHIPPYKKNNTVPEGFEQAFFNIGDSVFVMVGNCKNSWIALYTHSKVLPVTTPVADKVPFLKVHGNILYNFSYRSYIDTPFAQNDLQQHLVQTTLHLTVKDKYPVQMTVTNRSSNSPYFKNLTDVNLSFNKAYLLENIKNELKQKAIESIKLDTIQQALRLYENRKEVIKALQAWVNSPARAQEFVEEKERNLKMSASGYAIEPAIAGVNKPGGSIPDKEGLNRFFSLQNKGMRNVVISKTKALVPDSMLQKITAQTNNISNKKITDLKDKAIDSVKTAVAGKVAGIADKNKVERKDSSLLEKYNDKKQMLAKLQDTLKKEEGKIKQLNKRMQDSVNKVKAAIAGLKTTDGLMEFMKKNGIDKNELTKAQRVLLAVNQVGIGRSWVDYSELTVKNISLAGINVEANPSKLYVAFAAGKVNYRFRDFVFRNNTSQLPDQSLYIARLGVGKKGKNNFIVSFYNGKKAVLNYTASNTVAAVQKVLGISAEARLVIDRNNYIVAEVAKSSYTTNGSVPRSSSSELMGKAFNLNTRSNEAYSIKLFSQNPQTNTRLTAYYKKLGENFQSFNLYPVNINQDAWMIRLNQNFWKKRLLLDGAIRKNDFVSPVATPSFSSKTVFKSLQVSLRVPKYPFISVGYYPSSQLFLSDNNVLTENQYNTFNAIVSHSYQLKQTGMNTSAVYTKFYNNSTDTGFIYFDASSYTVNQSFFLGKMTLQTNASLTDQKDLRLFTLEQTLGYQFKNRLSLSGSLKWNRFNRVENLFGAAAMMSISLRKLGTVQFGYEKSYLPGNNRTLLPVDIGRMSFYREF